MSRAWTTIEVPQDRMQLSRFELKYMINEDLARHIRDFVRMYLKLDEYGVGKPNDSYPVHSLYLDSKNLHCYWSTVNSDKNRFKLRVRFYDDNPDAPVFFEIKRRMNNCILKERCAARRVSVERILAGFVPEPCDLASQNARHAFSLQNFVRLLGQIDARPKVHIAYLREAYVPHDDNSARLTMDRSVCSQRQFHTQLNTHMDKPTLIWGRKVVLELKFTDRCPDWFCELVRVFSLHQCGAAKYVEGITLLGEPRMGAEPGCPFGAPPDLLDRNGCGFPRVAAQELPTQQRLA